MYDIIIIGGGPSALAASIYAARQKVNFILITENIGGQVLLSSDIENYLGFKSISGIELVPKFIEQLEHNKVQIKEEKVSFIEKKSKNFAITTNKKNNYKTKTILMASGKGPRRLNIPGEDEFIGKGVSYCALCDAALFREKIVAVVGGGNAAMDAALLLEKYANKIFIITINTDLMGEPFMMAKIKKSKKIEVITNAKTNMIAGEKFVNGISIEINEAKKTLPVEGVFIEIGSIPSVDFDNLTKKNQYNEIILYNNETMSNMTSVRGIFAAGDVTNVQEKQLIVAAGEGVKAVLSIFKYLQSLK
ncbi:MAG: FAD-dependent oxidoreductase [Nanoarchaeota archaeon]